MRRDSSLAYTNIHYGVNIVVIVVTIFIVVVAIFIVLVVLQQCVDAKVRLNR